ncbi:hypothetical protein ACVNIS_21930 [Sphaerotilaceae bacterium SBD11-9]
MTHLHLRPLVAAMALALTGAAHAADGITHKISGYGTVAGTFTDTNDAEYTGSLNKFKGANKQIDTGVDSRLGLQGVVTFDPQFSMTAQALMQRRQDKDFDVGLEWFYGQYSPLPGVDIRLGRVMIPAFLMSDSINVGYAQPWMRAPGEVYAQMLTNTLDGVQIGGRHAFGAFILSGQIATGKSTFAIVVPGLGPVTVNSDHMVSYNVTGEYTDWTARVGQTKMHNSGSQDEFSSVGLQYDNGVAVVMAEATKRRNDTSIYNNKSWYVAGGWRFGKLLPMVMYGDLSPETENPVVKENSSVGVSLRYDVASNVAFKAQVNRMDTTAATFINKNASTPEKATVASFGLDFVF